MYCMVLYCTVLYGIVLHYIVLSCFICLVLSCIVLHCIVLYYNLYCIYTRLLGYGVKAAFLLLQSKHMHFITKNLANMNICKYN